MDALRTIFARTAPIMLLLRARTGVDYGIACEGGRFRLERVVVHAVTEWSTLDSTLDAARAMTPPDA